MPAVSTWPRNDGSFRAMSNASLNFRLFTVSVNSSTNPGGMAAVIRRSRNSSTTSASIATETARSTGPNTQPSDRSMNMTRPPLALFSSAGAAASWA